LLVVVTVLVFREAPPFNQIVSMRHNLNYHSSEHVNRVDGKVDGKLSWHVKPVRQFVVRVSRQPVTDLQCTCRFVLRTCWWQNGEVANLLWTCHLCCGLVTDLLATQMGSLQLDTDLLRGNWCNVFFYLSF